MNPILRVGESQLEVFIEYGEWFFGRVISGIGEPHLVVTNGVYTDHPTLLDGGTKVVYLNRDVIPKELRAKIRLRMLELRSKGQYPLKPKTRHY